MQVKYTPNLTIVDQDNLETYTFTKVSGSIRLLVEASTGLVTSDQVYRGAPVVFAVLVLLLLCLLLLCLLLLCLLLLIKIIIQEFIKRLPCGSKC